MSAWVGAAPMIGTGSLDGFAIGALMSGACALAITAPRRAAARGAPTARDGGGLAAERSGWLCEHVMAAKAFGAGVAAETAGAASAFEAVRGKAEIEAKKAGLAIEAVRGRVAAEAFEAGLTRETVRAGLTVGVVKAGPTVEAAWVGAGVEAIRARAAADPVSGGAGARALGAAAAAEAVGVRLAAEAFGAGAERLARAEELRAPGKDRSAVGRAARAGGGYRSRHRLGDPIPGSAPWDGADVVFPDAEFSERTFVSARRPEVRRLPRHAAPSVSLGSRITGLGSRMTGLFATRALASGARG